jgi:hypothetical protein
MAGMNRIPIAINDNPADAFFVDLDTTFREERYQLSLFQIS